MSVERAKVMAPRKRRQSREGAMQIFIGGDCGPLGERCRRYFGWLWHWDRDGRRFLCADCGAAFL